jgi:hypothetical protein
LVASQRQIGEQHHQHQRELAIAESVVPRFGFAGDTGTEATVISIGGVAFTVCWATADRGALRAGKRRIARSSTSETASL